MKAGARGFTLIELMVAVALVAVLAAVAYPSYQSQIKKSHRSDAKTALVSAAQAMERYFSEHATYVGATLGSTGVYASTSVNGYYALSLGSLTASGFTLTAAPAGSQSNDDCGSFTLDQIGNKGVSGGSLSASSCW